MLADTSHTTASSSINDFLQQVPGSTGGTGGGGGGFMDMLGGMGGMAGLASLNPYVAAGSAVMSQLDFSKTETGSAESDSGLVNLLGKLGSTGKLNFTHKLKTPDYLMLAGAGVLIYLMFVKG